VANETGDVHLRYPVNALVSYHYFDSSDIGEMRSWGLRIIGDSGAYSAASLGAPISLSSFATWADLWRDDLAWIASLDEIGDARGSWRNYKTLRKQGLDVVPTVHYGCDPKELDRYAADGVDFVGLGGMVPYKSEPERLLRWSLSMFIHARDNHPGMRFHGWGVTHPRLLTLLPWYSVDSSGFAASVRYAQLRLFDPDRGKSVGVKLNGRDIYKHSRLLRLHYGVEPSEVATTGPWNRRQVLRLSMASVQRMEDHLRKRHGDVSPPVYGLTSPANGLNVHGVNGHASRWHEVFGPQIHGADANPKHLADLAKPGTDQVGLSVYSAMGNETDCLIVTPSPEGTKR